MAPKAIIFDSDGMLTHGPRFSDVYAKDKGIDISEMIPFFTGPFQDCIVGKADLKAELQKGWLQKWQWHSTVEELLEYWFSVGDELSGAVFDTIRPLRDASIICVLATNNEKYRTENLSERFGYANAFDEVFASGVVGSKKPETEFFDIIFSYLQESNPSIVKEGVQFWDDDSENIAGAAAYGFDARLFTNPESYLAQLRESGLQI